MFLEPYRSGSCSGYMSCLACLSDQSCGWCPSLSRCLLRDGPDLEPCPESENGGGETEKGQGKGEDQRHLLLAPQHCTLCEEYRDCSACTQVQHRLPLKDFDTKHHYAAAITKLTGNLELLYSRLMQS